MICFSNFLIYKNWQTFPTKKNCNISRIHTKEKPKNSNLLVGKIFCWIKKQKKTNNNNNCNTTANVHNALWDNNKASSPPPRIRISPDDATTATSSSTNRYTGDVVFSVAKTQHLPLLLQKHTHSLSLSLSLSRVSNFPGTTSSTVCWTAHT